MELKNILEDQMATPLWFFRFPPPLIVVLAPLVVLVGLILGFGFFSIFLTSIALILPTLLFTCSKQEPILLEKLVEEKVVLKSENESASTQKKEVQEANNEAPKYLVAPQSSSSPDSVAESACLDDLSTSEGFEVLDWPFGDNVDQSPDCSDGSISDEESLIEISLPGGYYVGHDKEEESIFNLQQKMPGLSQMAIFQQHTLFELLAEINDYEEENLIEIDISMGSIKCSRFEIEA